MGFRVPEKYRLANHFLGKGEGCNGAFLIPARDAPRRIALRIIASDGIPPDADVPWEHVSVSTEKRPPYWDEMCFVKDLFWDPEDIVLQYHPRKSQYVNCHPHCLHLWRPRGVAIPIPPMAAVGPGA